MKHDPLGDRMKTYERAGTQQQLMPLLPALVRLDGVAFHTFTKGLRRPYDERLSQLMVDTTKYLVQLTGARIGYTQSDEISLALLQDTYQQQLYFDGNVAKINSVLASRATAYFNSQLQLGRIPEKQSELPVFDCRTWNVPNLVEAANAFLWREQDATRNSISMAANAMYSHTEVHGKSSAQMQEMIFQKGINWNDYPVFFKRGSYVRRVETSRRFSQAELTALPSEHRAKLDPDLVVTRSTYEVMDYGMPLSKIANRAAVLFAGEAIVRSTGERR